MAKKNKELHTNDTYRLVFKTPWLVRNGSLFESRPFCVLFVMFLVLVPSANTEVDKLYNSQPPGGPQDFGDFTDFFFSFTCDCSNNVCCNASESLNGLIFTLQLQNIFVHMLLF